jgi:hypothetical protein
MTRRIGVAVVFMLVASPRAFPQSTTTFTYQGELRDGGGLADGLFDMTFSLWSAAVGGSRIGAILVRDDVPVVEGRFTVQLDYGAAAFNNEGRFLQITVEGFTLAPRQPITRSPYAVQTRGIYVDDQNLVGIGTTSPEHALHVADDLNTGPVIFGHATRGSGSGAVGVTGQSQGVNGIGVYGFAASPTGLTYGVRGYAYSTNGIGVYGSAQRATGISYGMKALANSDSGTGVYADASSPTGNTYAFRGVCASATGYAGYFQGRGYFSGNVGIGITNPGAKLDVLGDSRFRNRLRLGSAPGTAGQLTIADSNDGSIHAIDAESDTTVFPTIYARNTAANGSVIWAEGNSDAEAAGGGIIVAGDQGGENIAIDANEIMARDAGQPSTLHLNAEGGQIRMGLYNIHPAFAYGKIDRDGTIISASSNITGVTHMGEGIYQIFVEGGFVISDIVILSSGPQTIIGGRVYPETAPAIQLHTFNHLLDEQFDTEFDFVVYRR